MVYAETVDGRVRVKCGQASGMDLICEAVALVTSVVRAVSSHEDNKDIVDEEIAKTAFKYIVTGAGGQIEERTGIDVFVSHSNEKDVDEDDDDDEDKSVVVKALPADSDTAKKILELLGIDPDEVKPKDDDETEDDIPDFLF